MGRKVALLATVGLAVVSGGVALATAWPASAATGCQVKYTVQNQRAGSFSATVDLTNLGDPLTSWTLKWTFADASQKVTATWLGTFTQSGAAVTVTQTSWNGKLGTNATVSPGFNGSFGTTNPVPTSFTLNGNTCTGQVTSGSAAVPS
jgi:hypothetical protein